MKIVKVKNLYGYPSYSETIVEYAKSIGAKLILDRSSLLKAPADFLKSDQPKILVDSFTALIHNEVPIIGFRNDRGIRLREPLPHKDWLVSNVVKVKVPAFNRLPAKMLAQALKAPVKAPLMDGLKEGSDEYKAMKAMFSPHLPASLKDKAPKVNKKGAKEEQ